MKMFPKIISCVTTKDGKWISFPSSLYDFNDWVWKKVRGNAIMEWNEMCVTQGQNTYKFSLLHAASSDPSVQSSFWSHIHANGMHSPSLFLQANSSDEHVLCSEMKQKDFDCRSVTSLINRKMRSDFRSWKCHFSVHKYDRIFVV